MDNILKKSCKYGHVSYFYESNSTCMECAKERSKKWKKQNKDRYNEYFKSYRHKDLRSMISDINEYVFEKEWRKRKNIKQATPSWANKAEIRSMYEQCLALSRTMNAELAVDHIVPISSRIVCGLHTHDNLQLVSVNLKKLKKNKFNRDKQSQNYYEYLKKNNL